MAGICDKDLSIHLHNNCNTESGGSNQVIVYKCGLDIDATVFSEVDAALTAGTARLIGVVRLDEPRATPNTGPAADGNVVNEQVINHTRTIHWIDQSMAAGNYTMYNDLNGSYKNCIIQYGLVGKQKQITVPIQFVVADMNPDALTDFRDFEIIGTYNSKDMFTTTAETAGIFDLVTY